MIYSTRYSFLHRAYFPILYFTYALTSRQPFEYRIYRAFKGEMLFRINATAAVSRAQLTGYQICTLNEKNENAIAIYIEWRWINWILYRENTKDNLYICEEKKQLIK